MKRMNELSSHVTAQHYKKRKSDSGESDSNKSDFIARSGTLSSSYVFCMFLLSCVLFMIVLIVNDLVVVCLLLMYYPLA